MRQTDAVEPKRAGRKRGRTQPVPLYIRANQPLIDRLDAWRDRVTDGRMSRSEAVRVALEAMIKGDQVPA